MHYKTLYVLFVPSTEKPKAAKISQHGATYAEGIHQKYLQLSLVTSRLKERAVTLKHLKLARILSHAFYDTDVFHQLFYNHKKYCSSAIKPLKESKCTHDYKTLNFTSRASFVMGRRSKIVTASSTAGMSKT